MRLATKKYGAVYVGSIALLIICLWLGVSIGSVSIPFSTLWDDSNAAAYGILWEIRMPRVVIAALVGAALALAGAAFQGLLKNPLADPYTLGISSGASVGAVMTIYFGVSIPLLGMFALPVFSMVGAFLTMLVVLLFARLVDRTMKMETLILTGIIFSAFLSAGLSLMIALTDNDNLRAILSWTMGSVSMRGWPFVKMVLPFFIIGVVIVLYYRRELNAMVFGEERAKHLGVNVAKSKYGILIGGSILTGSAVAVSGTIAFVGLVVPHMIRMLIGADHRHLLPIAMLNGASLLVLCDLLSRTIIAPVELPIGVITSFLGAPVFAYIFYRQRKGKA